MSRSNDTYMGQSSINSHTDAVNAVKEKIPGTTEHKLTHPTTGAAGGGAVGTHGHTTHLSTGGGVSGAVHKVKQAIPGTAEHKATHPTAGNTGMGMHGGTTAGGGVSTATKIKAAIPGTAEHKMTHPTAGHGTL